MTADKKNKNPGMVCNDDACMRIPMLDGYPAKMTLSEYVSKYDHLKQTRFFDDVVKAAKYAIKIEGQLYTEIELTGARLLYRKGEQHPGTGKWVVVKRSEPNST